MIDNKNENVKGLQDLGQLHICIYRSIYINKCICVCVEGEGGRER